MSGKKTRNLKARLAELEFFKGVSGEQLDLFCANAVETAHQPGEVIVSERQKVRGFFLLVSGRAKMFKTSARGREQTLYFFSPGEPFCLCSAFHAEHSPASVAVLEPSRIVSLSMSAFESIAGQDPALLFNIVRVLSTRLRQSMELIESLSLREIPQRVAAYLSHLPRTGDARIHLPMTHRELSKIIGVTPEALSRTLRRMADLGMLTVKGRAIAVLDEQGLADCMDNGL